MSRQFAGNLVKSGLVDVPRRELDDLPALSARAGNLMEFKFYLHLFHLSSYPDAGYP